MSDGIFHLLSVLVNTSMTRVIWVSESFVRFLAAAKNDSEKMADDGQSMADAMVHCRAGRR